MQPRPVQKPHWFSLKSWQPLSASLSWITLQKTLPGTLSRAMPLKLSQWLWAPFLCSGMVSYFTQSSGTASDCHMLAANIVNHCTTVYRTNSHHHLHHHHHHQFLMVSLPKWCWVHFLQLGKRERFDNTHTHTRNTAINMIDSAVNSINYIYLVKQVQFRSQLIKPPKQQKLREKVFLQKFMSSRDRPVKLQNKPGMKVPKNLPY